MALIPLAVPAFAASTSNSEFVIIPEEDVFGGDLYAGAVRVVVHGTLDGDLIAFAAEEIVINGRVNGSVTAVTPSLTVNGEVDGSVRSTGSRLDVSGDVAEDVVAAVVNAELTSSSSVGGDVLVWAWNASALGSIRNDLVGTQRHLDLAGDVGGDVDVSVTRLTVVDELGVGGDLGYRSDVAGERLELASVDGAVVNKTPLPPNLRIRALGLLGRFLVIIFLSVAAMSIAYGWPRRTADAVTRAGVTPIRKWLQGALIIFSPLIATAATGVILAFAPAAAAFPLLVVLVPVILALVGVALALCLVAGVPAVGWLGGVLFRRLDLYGSILVGSLFAGLIWYLPFVGWLVPVGALPLGLGSWIAAWRDQSPERSTLDPEAVSS